MQYNNPANPAYITSRIKLVREHLVQMSQDASISEDAALPSVACPAAIVGGVGSEARQLR